MAARCGECGIVLPFEHSNPEDLMLHTQMCHPAITAVRYDLEGKEKEVEGKDDAVLVDDDGEDLNPVATASTGTCECSSQQGDFKIVPGEHAPKQKLYRAKVEAWRPGLGYMFCPFCNDKTNPLIQPYKTDVSEVTSRSAFWMLACWPLCFLPLVMSGTNQLVYLYCSLCREYLGAYDRENMRVDLRKKKCNPCRKKAKRAQNNTC